ncbi:MAG: zinc ribbon domain-containing protein [Pyrinomonadaceae bacterium]|nr:zinc ribbon domain-containing protein [Pyrinomonadaceae bacterium]MBP6213527.1 zinc ribbon domain-containing protein [Pyrinomonadaceae bacterium]
MHCPSCGQQQVSNETKFCSKCGMPLGLVSDVLAHGGYLPQLAELHKKRKVFTRRNGMGFSLIWCLFFLLIMAPLWGILNIEELAGASAVIGIFGGLIMLISSLMYLPKQTPAIDASQMGHAQGNFQMPGQIMPGQQYGSLPPQQSIPVSMYDTPRAGNWRDTNDLDPVSVTENTTKLLTKEDH